MSLQSTLFALAVTSTICVACTAPAGTDESTDTSASAAIASSVPCAGVGWMTPDTARGIAGTYFRASLGVPADEMTTLGLFGDPPTNGTPSVPYWRTLASGLSQFGKASVWIPAPAPADSIQFLSQGNTLDVYIILGLVRDPGNGEIEQLCLMKGASNRQPFAMTRIGP